MARPARQPLKGRRRTEPSRQQEINKNESSDADDARHLIAQVFGSSELLHVTKHEATDLQITALVAITIRLCVQSWYSMITDDTEFVKEIRDLLTGALQELYRRLQTLDWQDLALNQLPAVLDDHLHAIDAAVRFRDKAAFRDLRPHPALQSPENALVWSQTVVSKVLPLLLRPCDMDNPALRVLVSEVLSEIIVYRGLFLRTSEPSFIWDTIARLTPAAKPRDQSSAATVPLLWHWLTTSLTFCWNLARQPVGKEHVAVLAQARIWSLLNTLLQLRQRVPWLYGLCGYLQWVLLTQTRALSYELDRQYSILIERWMSSDAIINLLQQTRHALFPGGALAPSRESPTAAEVIQSLNDSSEAIVDAMPLWTRRVYFGVSTEAEMHQDVKNSLAIFDDLTINQALMVALIELLVARLFPELT